MFSPCWVVFKACRTRPLCGAAHVEVFKLASKTLFPPGLRDFFHSLRLFFTHIIAAVKHTNTMLSHLVSRFFTNTHRDGHTHPTQSSAHKTQKSRRACPPPSLLSTVYIKAVSNCTLSLIGSAVQCAAVDSDKSFFQSPEECLPTAMSEDTGGGKKVNCPLAAIQMMS